MQLLGFVRDRETRPFICIMPQLGIRYVWWVSFFQMQDMLQFTTSYQQQYRHWHEDLHNAESESTPPTHPLTVYTLYKCAQLRVREWDKNERVIHNTTYSNISFATRIIWRRRCRNLCVCLCAWHRFCDTVHNFSFSSRLPTKNKLNLASGVQTRKSTAAF